MDVFDESSFGQMKEIPENIKEKENNYFSFELKNVLIIRSYTPSVKPLKALLKSEFPQCKFDILQVKNSSVGPVYDESDINNIFETKSKRGFRVRNILAHINFFKDKYYDAVIVLYGNNTAEAWCYNIDLYAYFVPARFHLGYDSDNHFKIISIKSILIGSLSFINGYCAYLLNVSATLFVFFYSMLWFLILSPLVILHKKSSKNAE